MIKRVISSRLPLLIYNPVKVYNVPYFREIYKAGGLPVFDAECIPARRVVQYIQELALEEVLFGVRITADQWEVADYLNQHDITNLDLVVLSSDPAFVSSPQMIITNTSHKVFVEVCEPEMSDVLDAMLPHGVIVKGCESGGRVSGHSSFILMQWYLEKTDYPVWVDGGVGFHTAPGLFAAGVCGIILRDQLMLMREAPVSEAYRQLVGTMSERDTTMLEDDTGLGYRVFCRPSTQVVKDMKASAAKRAPESLKAKLHELLIDPAIVSTEISNSVLYLGQDAAFARHFSKRSDHLKECIEALFAGVGSCLEQVDAFNPMTGYTAFARSMGVQYPIVQGPMANISDSAEFARIIKSEGAFPFLAMGNLPGSIVEKKMEEMHQSVGWFGAGIIGVDPLHGPYKEHVDLINKYGVRTVILAGGNATQAVALRKKGIHCFLHTPYLSSLKSALDQQIDRLVLEGADAGGHVSELFSLILWELALEEVSLRTAMEIASLTLVFAGGIATRAASHFISGMSATWEKAGVKVGISVGSGYLFTSELLATGGITQAYRDKLLDANRTVVMGKTVNLATRSLKTPFSDRVIQEEYQRQIDLVSLSKRKTLYEENNFGALLIAAKGMAPDPKGENLLKLSLEEQQANGNYSVGNAVCLFDNEMSVSSFHNRLFEGVAELHRNLDRLEVFSSECAQVNDEIAVVGLGGIFPDATDVDEFWKNIVSKKYSISEIPDDRLRKDIFYRKNRTEKDKCYTNLAGHIADYSFDNNKYGYTAEQARGISKSQKLILDAACAAVEDAGYLGGEKTLVADRTNVVIANCTGPEICDRHQKYFYPEAKAIIKRLPSFLELAANQQEDILQALEDLTNLSHIDNKLENVLNNIEAARIAAYLGLTGNSYSTDGACASSVIAIDCAMKNLLGGQVDCVIAGGVNTNLAPELYIGFSKMGALSATGSFPFDERADGFVIGEGAGAVVLKRVRDAIRDGDHIYGVIKGVGTSSDGKGKAAAAPNPRGQELAVRRCFEKIKTGITFAEIDFIEAHGTGTKAGDACEMSTICNTYVTKKPVGISSVKSQIGHLLGGAGIAGLIKVLMAIKNKTLPPNGRFSRVSEQIGLKEPFYIVNESRPWIADGVSRKAAISSFGFGGINTHMVVEEFTEHYVVLKREIFKCVDFDFNENRIVVVGMGAQLPGAGNISEAWSVLKAGKSRPETLPEAKFDSKQFAAETRKHLNIPLTGVHLCDFRFDARRYKIPPNAVNPIDRHQLMAIDTTAQAIAHAQLEALLTDGNKVAVIFGNMMTGENLKEVGIRIRIDLYKQSILQVESVPEKTKMAIAEDFGAVLENRTPVTNEDTFPGFIATLISGRTANFFNCNGVNFIVDAASASAAHALSIATEGLRCRDFDFVINGAVDTNLTPSVLKGFHDWGMLAEQPSLPFSDNGSGVFLGEGAVTYILTTYKMARQNNLNIYAEVVDVSFAGAPSQSLVMPSQHAYRRALDTFYKNNHLLPKQLDMVEVAGLSNPVFDRIEYQTLNSFLQVPLPWGNVKPAMGYLKSANVAVTLLKLILMNVQRMVVPNQYDVAGKTFIGEGSKLRNLSVALSLRKSKPFYFGANFYGVGGCHGHTVVSSLPLWLDSRRQSPQPIKQHNQEVNMETGTNKGKVVALLSGQGSQYVGMMKELYHSEETIFQIMSQGDDLFRRQRGYSLLDIMFYDPEHLNDTVNTQPAVFLATAALYEFLQTKGFQPDYFVGHSLGECSALYCAGVLSFEDAMRLVIKRADLMKASSIETPGKMVAVLRDERTAKELVQKSAVKQIWPANMNSNKQTVISGSEDGIEAFVGFLKASGEAYAMVNVNTAFHTPFFNQTADRFKDFLCQLDMDVSSLSRMCSNVTGDIYPVSRQEALELLSRQMCSPVQFVKCIETVVAYGADSFIEVGPGSILARQIQHMGVDVAMTEYSIQKSKGELQSINLLLERLTNTDKLKNVQASGKRRIVQYALEHAFQYDTTPPINFIEPGENGVMDLKQDQKDTLDQITRQVNNLILDQVIRKTRAAEKISSNKYNLYTGDIVIAGVAVGLPGEDREVFRPDNFEAVIAGTNCISTLAEGLKQKIVEKNIISLKKGADGHANYKDIRSTDDVIQLAARLGYFDLEEYGIDYAYDTAYRLAIAAGLEALKDAYIPLVRQYKTTTTGDVMADGYALPESMQERTGVVFSSVFTGVESLVAEMTKYYQDKLMANDQGEFSHLYYYLMENVKEVALKDRITEWYFDRKKTKKDAGRYSFKKNLLLDIANIGAAMFAQHVKARGANIHVSAACASATHAVGVAEDWIRTNRCDRVIVIGGEDVTSDTQFEWVGSTFLSMGIGSTKKEIHEAALPFDRRREGTIVGSGAVALILERAEEVKKRGFTGQAQVLGTLIRNSAFHPSRMEVADIAENCRKFIESMEHIHGLNRNQYTKSMLFMSHETYTPARGGSASAEVEALKTTFPDHYKHIVITNTKGYTGHTIGAGVEDAVMIKAMLKGRAPAIANLKDVPDEFADLSFSTGCQGEYEYGLHFAAGFGSHFSLLFVRRLSENVIDGNAIYKQWLKDITGKEKPELVIRHKTLCVREEQEEALPNNSVEPGLHESVDVSEVAAPPVKSEYINEACYDLEVRELIAEQTGYQLDMLQENYDLEADLGIDTVKQVEIFGKLSSRYGLDVPEDLKLSRYNTIGKLADYLKERLNGLTQGQQQDDEPNDETQNSGDTVEQKRFEYVDVIKALLVEQTGYEREMLDEEYDLEADLGIDTVKQVEIFGKLSSQYGLDVPEDLKLSRYNTIGKLADYVTERMLGFTQGVQQKPSHQIETQNTVDTVEQKRFEYADAIKTLIVEQTGYEREMLDENYDLEADLGIDTVKQVEVFGKLSSQYGLDVPEDLKLSRYNTIGKLIGYLTEKVRGQTADDQVQPVLPTPGQKNNVPESRSNFNELLKRHVVRVKQVSVPRHVNASVMTNKTLVVTMDHYGFADEFVRQVTALGARCITIGREASADYRLDFVDLQQVETEINRLNMDEANIDGVIHLAPLDFCIGKDYADFAETKAAVKSFFVIIKQLFDKLNKPNTLVASLSFNGVVLPYDENCQEINPTFAGIAGMMKTINMELSPAIVKMVDFEHQAGFGDISNCIRLFVSELCSGDKIVEVGYKNDMRFVLDFLKQPVPDGSRFVKEGDTVLVTGGARGITFEIVKELVRTYRTNLILVGRSDINAVDGKYLSKTHNDKMLLEDLARQFPSAKPVQIKKKAQQIINTRIAHANIMILRSLGVQVAYESVDVCDEQAIKNLIDKYAKIDGVIYGAGIDEGIYIPQKELASFHRVFDTKVSGVLNLLRNLSATSYRYFIGFSSIAARVNNKGQIDYSAANDMLGKIIQKEALKYPDRHYKVFDWPAWDGAGMAEDTTIKIILKSKGIEFIPVKQGVAYFMDELCDSAEVEILINKIESSAETGEILVQEQYAPNALAHIRTKQQARLSSLLETLVRREQARSVFANTFKLERDLYLSDHIKDNVPIVPGSFVLEMMAQASEEQMEGHLQLTGVDDFEIHYGIKLLNGAPKTITVEASRTGENRVACSVKSSHAGKADGHAHNILHATGNFCFAQKSERLYSVELPENNFTDGDVMNQIYHPERLFPGTLFHTVRDVLYIDADTTVTRFKNESRKRMFADQTPHHFITDAITIDAMFQSVGVMQLLTTNYILLPQKVSRLTIFAPTDVHGEYICKTKKLYEHHDGFVYDIEVLDLNHQVLIRMEKATMVKIHRVPAHARLEGVCLHQVS